MLHKIAKTLLFSIPLFLLPLNAQAQIAADGTTSTTVTPTDAGVRIDEGDRSGGNLFHSFQDFSVPTGTEAHFNNASDVANIFSRVTGGNISDIDGLIRANGTANLFLVNPNGIIFGENASLNIGGSFFATTADGILFDDGTAFSASDPTTPLLTSSIPVGANFRGQPGDIINRAGDVNNFTGGLTVSSGNTITLLGGNLDFDEGRIFASGANIELGGLTAEGTVDLGEDGSLIFPENITRGNITFDNSVVNVQSSGGGNITLYGKNINLENNSELAAGIAATSTNLQAQAGNIEINSVSDNPEEGITFDNSIIFNTVEARRSLNNEGEVIENIGGQGNAGDIQITGNFLSLDNGSQIQSLVRNPSLDENGNFVSNPNAARGNAGNIIIDVSGAVTITGEGEKPTGVAPSLISSEVQTLEGDFKAGNITINASSFSLGSEEPLANANRISSSIASTEVISSDGEIAIAGNIDLNIRDTVTITYAIIETNGRLGNIYIGASLPNESNNLKSIEISNSTISATNPNVNLDEFDFAGEITLNASDNITIANSTVTTDGNLGQIYIGSFNLSNLEEAENSVETVNSVDILDNSLISATNADPEGSFTGRITINASDTITIANSEVRTDGFFGRIYIGSPDLFGLVEAENSVEVETANSIDILNNSEISSTDSNTEGGAAGEITLNASDTITIADSTVRTNGSFGRIFLGNSASENISLTPPSIVDINNSSLEATNRNVPVSEEQNPVVDSGNIEITAYRDILLSNNSRINTFTRRKGDAGNVTLNAGNSIDFQGGSRINSTSPENVEGNPGTVRIDGRDNSLPVVSFDGNIVVVNEERISSGILTTADTDAGDRERSNVDNDGDVFINARSLSLTNAAQIQTSTTGNLDAGDVKITVDESLRLNGGSEIIAQTTGNNANAEEGNNATGNAGNITVEVRNEDGFVTLDGVVPVGEMRPVGGFSSGLFSTVERGSAGNGGNITVTTNTLNVLNSAAISTRSRGSGASGNITIDANNLEIQDGGQILAVAFNEGNAGNINVNVADRILIEGFDANYGARQERLDALVEQGSINRETADTAIDTIDRRSGILASTQPGSIGDGGNISINVFERDNTNQPIFTPTQLQLSIDEGLISTSTFGEGDAGNLQINTQTLILDRGGQVLSFTDVSGQGGSLIVNASDSIALNSQVNESNFTVISTRTEGDRNAGDLTLNTRQLTMQGNAFIESVAFDDSTGDAGNVAIDLVNQFSPNNDSDGTLTMIGEENNQPGISVDSNTGTAGNINITANFIEQDRGVITANTESTGANINLDIQDFWFLRNESLVSANATGSENQQSTGGNININSNNENSDLIIIAFPAAESQGNDITANGFGADAGQIDINANLLGTQVRNTEPGETGNNFLNDITARSDISNENNVEQSNVEDPSSSLVELPETVGDASDTIAQNPCEQGAGSEFLITGKGGFPANPQNNFSSNQVRVGLVQPVTPENQTANVENNTTSTEESEVVPAQGWVFNNEGKVVLTAYDPTNQGVQRNQQSLTGCSVSQNQAQQND